MKKITAALVARYWKAVAAFGSLPAAIIVASLVKGDWPSAADWRTALGYAVAAAFGVAVAPKNRS